MEWCHVQHSNAKKRHPGVNTDGGFYVLCAGTAVAYGHYRLDHNPPSSVSIPAATSRAHRHTHFHITIHPTTCSSKSYKTSQYKTMYGLRSPHLAGGPPQRLNRSSMSTEYSETSSFVSTVPSTASSVIGEFSVLCLHDYQPTDPDQMGFQKGDILAILKTEDNGWWAAARGTTIGWVPRGYVEPISDTMAETLKTVKKDLRVTADSWDSASRNPRHDSLDSVLKNGSNGQQWMPQRRDSTASSNTQSSEQGFSGNGHIYQAHSEASSMNRSLSAHQSSHQSSANSGNVFDYSHSHSASSSSMPSMSSGPQIGRPAGMMGISSSDNMLLRSPGTQEPLGRSHSAYNSPGATPSSEFSRRAGSPNNDRHRTVNRRASRDNDAVAYRNAKSAVAALPPYLQPQYGEGYLRLDSEGVVKSGTLEALVERLTMDPLKRSQETAFRNTFLMTYRTFTDAATVFELLTEHYLMTHPEELTDDEFNEWKEKKLRPCQTRVLATLTEWVERYRFVKDEPHMVTRLKEFLSLIKTPTANALTAKLLLQTIEKQESAMVSRFLVGSDNQPAQPIAPPQKRSLLPASLSGKHKSQKNELLKIDPTELANHLALVEYRLYAKIRPYECVMWPRVQRGPEVENLVRFCSTSDKLVAWVKYSILSVEGLGKRADLIDHWIKVAEKCRALNNISSMSALVAALASTVIIRLQLTWAHVSRASHMEPLTRLTDPTANFAAYRSFYANVNTSCVPFIGLYLTALTHHADQYEEYINVVVPVQSSASPHSAKSSISSSSPPTSSSYSPRFPPSHQHHGSDHRQKSAGGKSVTHINCTRLFKCAEVVHQMLRHQTKGYRQANASASAIHPVPDPHNAATINLGVENANVMAFVEGMLATGGVGPNPPSNLALADSGGGTYGLGMGPVGVAEAYYWQRSSELQAIEAETSDIRKGLEAAGF
ncbi:hypothetical protein FRB93_003103 [Tulasnella sp. JGI-2019a]|nr:hypothetical protein FRB93_003103 [Tulasnella sp. JGI-2019a]